MEEEYKKNLEQFKQWLNTYMNPTFFSFLFSYGLMVTLFAVLLSATGSIHNGNILKEIVSIMVVVSVFVATFFTKKFFPPGDALNKPAEKAKQSPKKPSSHLHVIR